jgi:hypothetical protein
MPSPAWIASHPGYHALHWKTVRVRGRARERRCFFHAERDEEITASDWAQLPGTSGKDVADYIALCRKCHVNLDGSNHPAGRGEAHHHHTLTAEHVRSIRELLGDGSLTHAAIAMRFNVQRQAIGKIKYGTTWRWLE